MLLKLPFEHNELETAPTISSVIGSLAVHAGLECYIGDLVLDGIKFTENRKETKWTYGIGRTGTVLMAGNVYSRPNGRSDHQYNWFNMTVAWKPNGVLVVTRLTSLM